MKFYDAGLTILIVVCVVSLIGVLSVKYLGNDNPVEEAAEEVIKLETGQQIDLTPGTQDAAK